MSSSKPYLRKKAILVMYKIFLKFPDALRPAFPRLKDRLDDPDTGMYGMGGTRLRLNISTAILELCGLKQAQFCAEVYGLFSSPMI